jgi:hypothetical protein
MRKAAKTKREGNKRRRRKGSLQNRRKMTNGRGNTKWR